MEIDRLKRVWQQDASRANPDTADEVRQVMERFGAWRRQVRWRDYRETAAAVACILIFGRLAFVLQSMVARGAAAFLAGSCVLTVARLVRANPGRQQADRAVALREFCETELRRIDAQIALLRSVPYWYVAPILIGVNVMFAALSPRLAWTIAYLVTTLVLGAWVCHINRLAVRRRLVPLREDLLRILTEES